MPLLYIYRFIVMAVLLKLLIKVTLVRSHHLSAARFQIQLLSVGAERGCHGPASVGVL